jgi:tryptophanyl-tRNA synthetase
VRSFNRRWGKTFPEPEPVLTSTPKILGLDGKAKMSKSIGNTIALAEADASIRKKLAGAATDPQRVRREDPGDPDQCNVYTLHTFFSDDARRAWVRQGCTTAGIGCKDCKDALADNLIAHLQPIRARKAELVAQPARVAEVLADGAARASSIAKRTMADVRGKLGLWPGSE